MVPEQLVNEVEALRQEGLTIDLTEAEGVINIIFTDYPVSDYYNKSSTQMLLRFPMSYPLGRSDMFWTTEDLLRKDGGVPKSADTIETWVGKRWRRFSWHPSSWNPGVDNLKTFLEFVNNRLAKRE